MAGLVAPGMVEGLLEEEYARRDFNRDVGQGARDAQPRRNGIRQECLADPAHRHEARLRTSSLAAAARL